MSLINKMLQDLDARGGGARGDSLGAEIRAVPAAAAPRSRVVGLAAGAVVVAAAAAGATWWFTHGASTSVTSSPPASPTPRIVRQSDVRTPLAAVSAAGGNIALAGASRAISAPAAADPPQQVTPPEQMIDPASIAAKAGGRGGGKPAASDAGGGQGTASGRNGLVERRTETPARRETPAAVNRGGGQGTASGRNGLVERRTETPARREKSATAAGAGQPAGVGAAATKAPSPVAVGAAGDASPQQRATVLFQRAQARLVEARVGEAIVNLEAALQIDPQHEAARQTLTSLLVENGRHADAMRHLQQGLALDSRQTGMAMLLARLQLEHGGPAVDTLQTSLSYAQNNADYRALFAGILQRAQRHKEAVEHYTAAVQLQPQQGIWWMGLGISLQAEQRNAEAKAAFTRARDSGRLSPELQTFVERKLQQVSGN